MPMASSESSAPRNMDLGPGYLIGNWTLAAVATLLVGFKVYTRKSVIRIWRLEEYMTILALVR